MESLYRRPLPEGLIAFGSSTGRTLFREALTLGTMENYFVLAEQHHTQADPAFCGLGSLVVALNALAIDPGRLWKGPWRWFSEELLDCCVSLEAVRSAGLTLDEVACLARCNGADAEVMRASDFSADELREAILRSSQSASGPLLIAAYVRSALGQTGSGHFSPIAGYHAGQDLALVLDVARFKYPPHWVPVSQLFEAMLPLDPETGRSRGMIALSRAERPTSLALVFARQGDGWRSVARYVGEVVLERLRATDPQSAEHAIQIALGGAADVSAEIALRPSVEPPHREAVELVRAQLRASPAYAIADRIENLTNPELAATLLYMVASHVWDIGAPKASAELRVLLGMEKLAAELRNDLIMLRKQLAELGSCSGACPAPTTP